MCCRFLMTQKPEKLYKEQLTLVRIWKSYPDFKKNSRLKMTGVFLLYPSLSFSLDFFLKFCDNKVSDRDRLGVQTHLQTCLYADIKKHIFQHRLEGG